MTPLRIFSQTMAALTGKTEIFSREFIQWLRTLVDRVNELAALADHDDEIRTIEEYLGEDVRSGHFTIDDDDLTSGDLIMIQQAPGPYTNKGTLADEAEMDQITVSAMCDRDGFGTAYWTSSGFVRGNFKFNYRIHTP
jgi:hypothetical protein